jgi:hypothetical protein
LSKLKTLVAGLIDEDGGSRFHTEVSSDLATLVEGQVDVVGDDEIELPKSKAFQIEED